MRDLSQCKKFVAVYSKRFREEYVGIKIRIVDVEQWNEFHKFTIGDYHWEVYNQIEELGLIYECNNSFSTDSGSFDLTLDDFKKIFAPLKWIKVIDWNTKKVKKIILQLTCLVKKMMKIIYN